MLFCHHGRRRQRYLEVNMLMYGFSASLGLRENSYWTQVWKWTAKYFFEFRGFNHSAQSSIPWVAWNNIVCIFAVKLQLIINKYTFFSLLNISDIVFFQNLCVNEEVRQLSSMQRINDRCMEMQKNKHGQSTTLLLEMHRLWNFGTKFLLLLCY